MENIKEFVHKYLMQLTLPHLTVIDIIEMIIIAFAIYQIIMWLKNTRAWMLLKGIIFLLVFCAIAVVLQMDVILWIFRNAISVGIIAIVIVFQPELRSALEQLGRKNALASWFSSDDEDTILSERSINCIVKAVYEMARSKTGALIVMEKDIELKDIERSGISMDAIISMQLLMNIFEHNTPLHDGAVIIRNNRILAATCYLPLTDNHEISKDLGTRHRAAVGISEASDSTTIVVSEETGTVSIAENGTIRRDISRGELKEALMKISGAAKQTKRGFWRRKEGKIRHEEKHTG